MKKYGIFFLDPRSMYLNSLGDSLAQLGHTVAFQTSWNFAEIEAGIRYFQPDILITIGSDVRFRTPMMEKVPDICRRYNLFHIYWATEDKIQHQSWSIPFVLKIKPDLVWTLHPHCVAAYQSLGIHTQVLNFCFNPRMFPAGTETIEQYDVALVATTHVGERTYRFESFERLLIPLVRNGIRTDIWGYGWDQDQPFFLEQYGTSIPIDWWHGYLPYKESAEIYHSSRMVLGIQNAEDQISQRTIEILGSGACVIADRTPILEQMFLEGEEIVLTGSQEETLSLIRYYLERPDERRRIGDNGRKRVLSDHQYSDRLGGLWPELEQWVQEKRNRSL